MCRYTGGMEVDQYSGKGTRHQDIRNRLASACVGVWVCGCVESVEMYL